MDLDLKRVSHHPGPDVGDGDPGLHGSLAIEHRENRAELEGEPYLNIRGVCYTRHRDLAAFGTHHQTGPIFTILEAGRRASQQPNGLALLPVERHSPGKCLNPGRGRWHRRIGLIDGKERKLAGGIGYRIPEDRRNRHFDGIVPRIVNRECAASGPMIDDQVMRGHQYSLRR